MLRRSAQNSWCKAEGTMSRNPWHVPISQLPSEWAAQARKGNSLKASGWARLRHAKISGDAERIKAAASKCIAWCDSEDRLLNMLKAIGDQPPEIFWPLWLAKCAAP